MTEAEWTNPSLSLLVKLGSLLVHIHEYVEPGGHPLDLLDLQIGMHDPDVAAWIEAGIQMSLLPLKRTKP